MHAFVEIRGWLVIPRRREQDKIYIFQQPEILSQTGVL
jgi:hypothetical protein